MASPKRRQILSERNGLDESTPIFAMQREMKLRPTVFSTRSPQEAAAQPLGSEPNRGPDRTVVPGADPALSGAASTASTASTPRAGPAAKEDQDVTYAERPGPELDLDAPDE